MLIFFNFFLFLSLFSHLNFQSDAIVHWRRIAQHTNKEKKTRIKMSVCMCVWWKFNERIYDDGNGKTKLFLKKYKHIMCEWQIINVFFLVVFFVFVVLWPALCWWLWWILGFVNHKEKERKLKKQKPQTNMSVNDECDGAIFFQLAYRAYQFLNVFV